MNIVRNLLVSLAGIAAAASLATAGCTTNNDNTGGGTSDVGETCTRTFDCKSGLVCVANTCFREAIDASAGDAGDAGTTSTGPHLGLLNESCQRTSDCEAPLQCINGSCAPGNFNLTATGKSCSGECNAPADCCELPAGFNPNLQTWYDADGGYYLPHYPPQGSTRCEDLLSYLGGSTAICNNADSTAQFAAGCFLYNTYCNCMTNNPWACTNNLCVYNAPCTTDGPTIGGCPSETRGTRPLGSTCSNSNNGGAGAGTCSSGCVADSDCDGKSVSTPTGSHLCGQADAGGENCICHQSSCYFKCSKDFDCAAGYTCDTATSLCKQVPCTSDQNCVLTMRNPRAQCVTMTGQCQIGCQSDIECSTSVSGPQTSVCSGGLCKPAGCTSNGDCVNVSLGISASANLLCVPTPATTTTYASAITN